MAAIKNHLFRSPERRGRHVLVVVSGCVLLALGLLYAGIPRALQMSVLGIGLLNLLLGVAELVPDDRARLAGALRLAAYLAFAAGLVLAAVAL